MRNEKRATGITVASQGLGFVTAHTSSPWFAECPRTRDGEQRRRAHVNLSAEKGSEPAREKRRGTHRFQAREKKRDAQLGPLR